MVEFGAKSRDNDRAGLSLRFRKTGFYNIDGSVTLNSESLRRITSREELAERRFAFSDVLGISGTQDTLQISDTEEELSISR